MVKKKISCIKGIVVASVTCCVLLTVTIAGNFFLANRVLVPAGEPVDSGEIVTQRVSGIIEEMDMDELTEKSNLIIRGVVADIGTPIQIEAVGGGITNFTNYTIQVSDVISGTETETAIVRVQGGTVNDLEVICDEAPDLVLGKEYILFLYRPDLGGGYNTTGDYHYITGMYQGVYEIGDGDSEFVKMAIPAERQGTSSVQQVSISQFVADIDEAKTKLPSGYIYSVDSEFQSNLQANLESGFISQEEYEQMLAEREQYATILN